jgi:hypothetical protein
MSTPSLSKMPDKKSKALYYAHEAISSFEKSDIKSAALNWNKIYDMNLDSAVLADVMRLFSDEQVFAITDYLKKYQSL